MEKEMEQLTKTLKYRPSNGTEGDSFILHWCGRCALDRAIREGEPYDECDDDEVCDIVSRTFIYDVNNPEYPPEWTFNELGPCCTAFVEFGESIPLARCPFTLDLFDPA